MKLTILMLLFISNVFATNYNPVQINGIIGIGKDSAFNRNIIERFESSNGVVQSLGAPYQQLLFTDRSLNSGICRTIGILVDSKNIARNQIITESDLFNALNSEVVFSLRRTYHLEEAFYPNRAVWSFLMPEFDHLIVSYGGPGYPVKLRIFSKNVVIPSWCWANPQTISNCTARNNITSFPEITRALHKACLEHTQL